MAFWSRLKQENHKISVFAKEFNRYNTCTHTNKPFSHNLIIPIAKNTHFNEKITAQNVRLTDQAPNLTSRASGLLVVRPECLPNLRRKRFFSSTAAKTDSGEGNHKIQKITVTFVDKDGEEIQVKVPIGMSMLEAAHENDIELEGACEGSLACSTCHVIVMDVEQYNKLPDPSDEENDMLDLAFGLTETSRLGCQIYAKPEYDGLRLAIPSATRNFAVDGFKPKPH